MKKSISLLLILALLLTTVVACSPKEVEDVQTGPIENDEKMWR